MSDAVSPLDQDEMRLLAEIGFVGAQSGQPRAARALFRELLVMRPDSTLPYVGLATADIEADAADDAVRLLRDEGLKRHPDDAELMAFLGLALQCAGRHTEANKVLCAVLERKTPEAQPHVAMAAKLLANDVQRTPASLMPRWNQSTSQPASGASR